MRVDDAGVEAFWRVMEAAERDGKGRDEGKGAAEATEDMGEAWTRATLSPWECLT